MPSRFANVSRRSLILLTLMGSGCGDAQGQPQQAIEQPKTDDAERIEPAATDVDVLQTFMDELIAITPSQGAFPASFLMGSPDDADGQRSARLKESFAIAKYEVPQNLYMHVMGNNPSRWTGPRNSVERMTYSDALQFCEKLTELLRERKLIAPTQLVRLPTETEWEYCCRGGTVTPYSFGESAQAGGDVSPQATILDSYGWHTGNAAGNDPAVGSLAPNPWGLYDVHGYLWEFCLIDPENSTADHCSIRGGSWKEPFENLRSSSRRLVPLDHRGDDVGFRCVLSR